MSVVLTRRHEGTKEHEEEKNMSRMIRTKAGLAYDLAHTIIEEMEAASCVHWRPRGDVQGFDVAYRVIAKVLLREVGRQLADPLPRDDGNASQAPSDGAIHIGDDNDGEPD